MKTIKVFIAFLAIFLGMKYSNAQKNTIIVNTNDTIIDVYDLYYTTGSGYINADTIRILSHVNSVKFMAGNTDYCPPNLSCPDWFIWSWTGGGNSYNHIITLIRDVQYGTFHYNSNNEKFQICFLITIDFDTYFMCSP